MPTQPPDARMKAIPMRALKLLVLSLFAAGALATATELAPAPTANIAPTIATTAPSAPPLPLLWKVSDADNAVYLLGSFHLLKESDYPVSADVEAALAGSARVVFEITPEQLKDPATAQKFMAIARYDGERTLDSVLPADLRDKLDALLLPRGGSTAQLDDYKPWFVNLSLVLGLSQALGFSPERGLDQYLMQRAAAAGKATGGLESIDAQLQALDGAPVSEQIAGLADFLDRPQDMPAMLGDMHVAWRSGDVERLEALTGADMREHTPETYRMVIVDRNDAWTPKLRAMLDGPDTTDTLVVVGALHLLGEDGVVEKLRAQGYSVQRICSACPSATAPQ